jgi:filamentous hemagglutinin
MLAGVPVGPVSRARRETAEVGGGFLDDLAGMYRRWREEGVSPQELGLNGSIADDPVLHRLFEDAMRSAASSRRNNKYKELLRIYERGDVPSQEELQLAWDTVSGKFITSARRLNYTIAEVHHWNFPKHQFPLQVFDPRNLYITSTRAQHELLHRLTTFARRLWNGPVDETSRMVFDDVYYLAPRP